ncbi:hypothetical protein [Parageobacillus thermoglucosidasius]|uniref:Uncharacterized protein n=1 Tax=Parageobacillus thermoglucosidasius TaxID=1426 RepID=A0A1B7KWV7_PARTM|nr:hypothetical protein [Parageobacillus thermoglucosidasius]OAT74543.1 hypothetical protein A7K69_02205 [Parageobacillus thermoglucosidasius]
MNQLTIFDFVEDEQIADSVILNRIQSAFPGWEVLGYMKDWEWGKSDDYAAIIRRDNVYKWVRVELYHDGRSRADYTERTDFEPYWFEQYEKKGRHWVWRSLDDRNRVFEVARKNMG